MLSKFSSITFSLTLCSTSVSGVVVCSKAAISAFLASISEVVVSVLARSFICCFKSLITSSLLNSNALSASSCCSNDSKAVGTTVDLYPV